MARNQDAFDYESKPFGLVVPTLSPWYFQSLKLTHALEALKEVKGRVLEVGCGGGGMAKAIKAYRPDLEVCGCDISRRSLKMARQNGGGVKFKFGDLYQLPYQDSSLEAVVMFDTFEHLEDPARALNEIKRVLKKGGVLHSATPLEGEVLTLHGLLRVFGWQVKEKWCGHVQMYRLGEPEKLMKQAGFKVKRTVYSGHFFYQLADVAYFTLLMLRGKNADFQVEGYVAYGQPGVKRTLVRFLKNLLATVSYLESRLLFFFPGGFGHQTAVLK